MKKGFLIVALMFLTTVQNVAEAQELAVSDVENSGCLARTRGEEYVEPTPTIVLTKEGSILSVQILNYESQCATAGFNVKNSISEGSNGIPSLTINVFPYDNGLEANCYCPFNVSFTIRDLETNTFYLNCWWYEGLVTLEEGKPLVLEDITLYATIDGVNYTLKKTLGTATLTKVIKQKTVMRIPAELEYEGQTYAVKTITYNSFRDCTTIKTLDIPESVSTIPGYSFYGCILDTMIIRGFLESQYINSSLLHGMGTDMEVFVQPSEVEKYKAIYEGPVHPLSELSSQDEYVYNTITCREGDTLQSESPVSTASTLSKTETVYKMGNDIRLCEGDLITGVTFKGYNLGEEKTRHISVWIKQDYELGRLWNFTPTDKMTKVYDGDCKILHGGTADHLEDILDIVFSTPVAYVTSNLRMTIISEGEASSDSVFFLHTQEDFVESIYATAGEDGQLCDPIKSSMPFATFTIATPVRYVSGTVTDEDDKGIVGATVRLRGMAWGRESNYEGITDVEGKYRIRIEEGNGTYLTDVSAPGHTSYHDAAMGITVKDNPIKDFTLYGSVTYPAHEQSSIILPVAPDATIGKYYKLVRREGKRFIFEREPSPQANVPYVLFADRDYRVDLADMDLSITPGRIDLDSLSIVGSYSNGIYDFANYIDRDLDANSTTGTAMHAHLYGHFSLLLNDYELVFVENTLQRGDANGDGNLTVADMTAIAHYVLGNTPEGFSETNADANQDGQVNVADYTAVAHLLLYGSIERPTQTAFYYYNGKKIPLTPNESKVCLSIPKDSNETCEKIRANVQVLVTINDADFDFIVIPRSDFETLTSLDFWEEDAKSVIITSSYFAENNEEVYATPYLNVKLKKEQDTDLLASYAEKYRLRIVSNDPFMPLWYILSVTPESNMNPLDCANELWESGDFAHSVPDLAGSIQFAATPSVSNNMVYISPVTTFDGDELILSVKMKNAVDAEGFQFNLELPEGVSVVLDGDGQPEVGLSEERTTATRTNTFSSAMQDDGSLTVMAASTNASAISVGDGEVCTVRVRIASDMAEGDYSLTLRDVAISDAKAKSHDVALMETTLTVNDPSGIVYIKDVEPKTENRVYDLQGRRLSSQLKKGVYILNGKKYVR